MALGQIYLLRHGETEWSKSGQHTGRTDIPLTDNGRRLAAEVKPMIEPVSFARVVTSPLSRARDTAELAGLKADAVSDDLLEWNYGVYEGRTTADIRKDLGDPNWTIWDSPIPEGESPEDVAARARHVLDDVEPTIEQGENVALVAHGHLLRILTATYLGLASRAGRLFVLDPGAVAVLGHERTQPAIAAWNVHPGGLSH